MQLQKAGRKE